MDPNGPDVHWSTLEALAGFKKAYLTKPELWILLAAGMFIRTLPRDGRVRLEDASKLTLIYGTEQWRAIYQGRLEGALNPADAREEYVNLMRWRARAGARPRLSSNNSASTFTRTPRAFTHRNPPKRHSSPGPSARR